VIRSRRAIRSPVAATVTAISRKDHQRSYPLETSINKK